jgi:type VI secretion system secreted protein Hcp
MRRIPSIRLRPVPLRSCRGRRLRVATVAAVGAALAVPVSASAATDQFLRLGGSQYEAETSDPEFAKAIAVQSASFNVKRASRTVSAPTFGNLTITKTVDRSSPALMLAAASGKLIPWARLSVRRMGDTPTAGTYLEYCFENVVVMSDQVANVTGGDHPGETVALSYQKVTQSYSPISDGKLSGAIVAGWSLIANGPISVFPVSCGK